MDQVAHIILTRFNVPTKGREADVRARNGWLERRFQLFDQYCLPSVSAQTVRDFRWIIYFDRATPALFRAQIRAMQGQFPFLALFREDLPLEDVVADVRSVLPPGTQRVLTTRLDNDDALARDFVARLQQAARVRPIGTALNFPEGFAWRDGWVFGARDESSPFASALEPADHFETIWARPHALLAEKFRLAQLAGGPAWLQVIHGDNVTNRIKGRQRPGSVLGRQFAIRPGKDVRSPGLLDASLETLLLYPARLAREKMVQLAKPFLKVVR
ncbi:MAG: hypothetical protein RL764_2045 [Pseudomonadota bacterium]|jgi:hypothetical protein